MSEQPDQGGYNDTDENHRHNREIECEIVALNDDVAGQAAERNRAEPGPAETDQQNCDTGQNEQLLHLLNIYSIVGTYANYQSIHVDMS